MKYILYNIVENGIPRFICNTYLNKSAKPKDIRDYYNSKFKYYYYVPVSNGIPVFRKKIGYWEVNKFHSQNSCIDLPNITLCNYSNCISVVNHLGNNHRCYNCDKKCCFTCLSNLKPCQLCKFVTCEPCRNGTNLCKICRTKNSPKIYYPCHVIQSPYTYD